jgi:hypothetical protein
MLLLDAFVCFRQLVGNILDDVCLMRLLDACVCFRRLVENMFDDICLNEVAIPIVIAVAIPTVIPISIPIMIAVIRVQATINLSIALIFIECDTIAIFAFDSPGWLDLGLIN